MLIVVLVAALPVVALYRLTAKGPATKTLSYTMAGLTSPEGIDSNSGIKSIKEKVAQKGSETIQIGGIPVTFTAEDVNNLSPRELRLKVFGTFADRFYDQGASGLIQSQGLDESAAEKFKKDSSLISFFTKSAHQQLQKIAGGLVLASLLLAGAAVYFSNRFGRLVSPGLVLLLVGLPGALFAAISSSHPEVSGTARSEGATSTTSMLTTFSSFVTPLVMPYFASTYLFALILGFVFLLSAGVGRAVYGFTHRAGPTKEAQRK